MHGIVYAGVPLERGYWRWRTAGKRWLRRARPKQDRPAVVARDDRSVRMLVAAFNALPEESREEVREQLMQAIVTFERTNDVAPVVDFVQSVLITVKLNANPRYQAALREAEADSWDESVSIEEMIEAVDERRRAAQGRAS